MKVIRDEGQVTCEPEGETLEDIACSIIMASYQQAHPFGYGFMRAHTTDLTKDMALRMLKGEDISRDYFSNPNEVDKVHMDYVFGRCCKTTVEIDREANKVNARISTVDQKPGKVMSVAKEILHGFNRAPKAA